MKIPPVLVSGAPLLDLLAQGFLHFPRLLDGGRLSMSEEGLFSSLELRLSLFWNPAQCENLQSMCISELADWE